MRIIKLVIISIVFIFILATLLSLLIPSHVRISKAINISGNKDSVFSFVKDSSKWRLWHPAFVSTDSVQGIHLSSIERVKQNDSEFVVRMNQRGRRSLLNGWRIYQYTSIDSLTLQWYIDFQLKWYPWEKFGSLFYENLYGPMMQQGLTNIKNLSNK